MDGDSDYFADISDLFLSGLLCGASAATTCSAVVHTAAAIRGDRACQLLANGCCCLPPRLRLHLTHMIRVRVRTGNSEVHHSRTHVLCCLSFN